MTARLMSEADCFAQPRLSEAAARGPPVPGSATGLHSGQSINSTVLNPSLISCPMKEILGK